MATEFFAPEDEEGKRRRASVDEASGDVTYDMPTDLSGEGVSFEESPNVGGMFAGAGLDQFIAGLDPTARSQWDNFSVPENLLQFARERGYEGDLTYSGQSEGGPSIFIGGNKYQKISDPAGQYSYLGPDVQQFADQYAYQHPVHGWIMPVEVVQMLNQLFEVRRPRHSSGFRAMMPSSTGGFQLDPHRAFWGDRAIGGNFADQWKEEAGIPSEVDMNVAPIVAAAAITAGTAAPALAGATAGTGAAMGYTGATAAAIDAAAAAAMTGAANGAMAAAQNDEDIWEGALQGAAAGAAGAAAGAGVNAATGDLAPVMQKIITDAARAAVSTFVAGGDPFAGAAQGAISSAIGSAGRGLFTPTDAAPAFDPVAEMQKMPLEAPSVVSGPQHVHGQGGMFQQLASPELLQSLSGQGVVPGATGSLSLEGLGNVSQGLSLEGLMPLVAGLAPEPEDSMPALVEAPTDGTPEPTAEASAPQPASVAQRVQTAIDVYQKLTGLMVNVDEFTLPEQGSMSDEEYRAVLSDSAIDYLGLDADAMREAGLEPGTQEYLDYILQQADALIQAAFGENPEALLEGESVEALQNALRDLTEVEMEQLARAMYVRGALGGVSFAEEAVDPFTGEAQELGLLEGESADPSRSATMRGYAEFLKKTARLSGPEARTAIRGMLGRDVDLFDLEKGKAGRDLDKLLKEMLAGAQDERADESAGDGLFGPSFMQAQASLPDEAGVDLKLLRGKGLRAGIAGARNPQERQRAQQLIQMYNELPEEYRERIDRLERDGRVPAQGVIQLYKEWQSRQQRA